MTPQSLPALIMAAISFYVGVYHLLIHFRRSQGRVDLAFGVTCLTISLYDIFCAGLYSVTSTAEGVEWQRVQVGALCLVGPSFLWFVYEYTGKVSNKILVLFTSFYLPMAAVQFLTRSELTWTSQESVKTGALPFGLSFTYYEMLPGPLSILISMVGLIAIIYICFVCVRYFFPDNREKAKPLLAALIFFFLGIINDSAVNLGLYPFIYTIEFAYMGLVLLMAHSLANELIETSRVKESLRKSEEQYRLLAENATDVIFALDLNLTYTFIGPAVERLRGFTVEEVLGQPIDQTLASGSRGLAARVLAEELEREQGEAVDYSRSRKLNLELVCKDGSTVWTEILLSFLRDESNRPIGILGVTRDITERIQAEDERDRLQGLLQQARKMQAVGTLSSGIAHDFNNLLQSVSGLVQILAARSRPEYGFDRYYSEIDHLIRRGADLVSRLLMFGRNIEPKLRTSNLNDIVEESARILERTIPRMIEIKCELDKGLEPINADPGQLESVILNLGTNARDAMPQGGELRLATSNTYFDEKRCFDHPGTSVGAYAHLCVSDTGVGMDPETMDRVFEPFFTTKDIGMGAGLGLSTAYGVVRGHGGIIKCSSRPGKGTTLDLYFPTVKPAAASEPENGPVNGKDDLTGRESVLVVDDEASILSVARDFLELNGYTVYTADCGEEALSMIQSGRANIDLVIMDLGMPGMGGRRCLEQLTGIKPDLPVLVASGYSGGRHERDIIKAGAKGYINKPYSLSELLIQVRACLDRAGEGP